MLSKYFRYYISDSSTETKSFYDIRSLLSAYCKGATSEFKNQIMCNDDHLYLVPHIQDTYLFVVTREDELVKRINNRSITVKDISDILHADEQLGYASYVHFEEDHFAFGNTIFAPKIDKFLSYMNQLFQLIGANNLIFGTQHIASKATKEEILDIPVHGRAEIEMPIDGNAALTILNVLGIKSSAVGIKALESLQLTFKPKYRQDISSITKPIIRSIPKDDYTHFTVKAKREFASAAIEYHMNSYNDISDYIKTSKSETIHNQMINRLHENLRLAGALKTLRSKDDVSERRNESFGLDVFSNPDSWIPTTG